MTLAELARRPIHFQKLWPRSAEQWTSRLLILGALLRLAAYGAGRSIWLDESLIRANLGVASPFALLGPLGGAQVVPPAFLFIERLAFQVLGGSAYSVRLFTLICGLASLPLFAAVARRVLPARAVPLAVALFVLCDDLIYYASELKPYASDVTAALACWLAALEAERLGLNAKRALGLAVMGMAAVWFSFPVVFVLAGIGAGGLVQSMLRARWKEAGIVVGIALAWGISFLACQAATRTQIDDPTILPAFWNFAFLPRDGRAPRWLVGRLVYLLANPLDYYATKSIRWMVVPALVAGALGVVELARRRPLVLSWLLLPMAATLCAAALRAYPFHGRTVLFLTPGLFLLLAAGVEFVGCRTRGRWPAVLLAAYLVAVPLGRDLYQLTGARERDGLNPHGDRRPSGFEPELFTF